ncbi:MAG: ATP-binding protein [Bacteroidales bacterium]|jgi:hypothetical protein|nr:ATP-binding protein [Bacteroidales bacterium]
MPNSLNIGKVQKIPFKVSARTARLIGRENMATSKGAIIELVKNSYDADSKFCIVYFDNYHAVLHDSITTEYYEYIIKEGIKRELVDAVYERKRDSSYSTRDVSTDEERLILKLHTAKLSSLYIIDAGEGMTQKTIRDYWMTIGTDNKKNEYYTKSGRIKAGAKGIGRFALDKLGAKCEMITIFNPNHSKDIDEKGKSTQYNGYKWNVNWEDFEGEFKTIENVNAQLIGLSNNTLDYYVSQAIPADISNKIEQTLPFKYGTILKITELRDNWEDFYVNQMFADLEVLVPPKENNDFNIFLLSSLEPNKYGEVLSFICDDYDYKLLASADENQNVHLKIIRNEYDLDIIPKALFNRSNMQKEPYTFDNFHKGFWEITKTFSQLIPGFNAIDKDSVFNNIGIFDFSFYYLKRNYTTDDANKFFYKRFNANERKKWLENFGGVKIFRDNFRVRPYGEKQDAAFDWLGLGSRKSKSPAGVSKLEGGYRVEPENVSGAIKISRLTNVNFEDKSSREGVQENKTFQIFKILIQGIINEFEKDRSYIAREMYAFDQEVNGDRYTEEKAKKIAKEIRLKNKDKKKEGPNVNEGNDTSEQLLLMAVHTEKQEQEIERLKEEQKLLRVLASSGLVLASFSHDLSKINDVLSNRFDKLKNLMKERISEADYDNTENWENPFYEIERMKKDDIKMKNWLNFSLGTTRKDKRRRKQLFLEKYFINSPYAKARDCVFSQSF